MNRPQKVKAIYLELKAALGSDISERELLEAAASVLDIHYALSDTSPKASIAENNRSFESLELYRAIDDGGWEIMNRERELMKNFYMQSDSDYSDQGDLAHILSSIVA